MDPYGYTRQLLLTQGAPDILPADLDMLSLLNKMLMLRPMHAVCSHAVRRWGDR